jgi:hypothetical protein
MVPRPNPILADSSGLFPPIYLAPGEYYAGGAGFGAGSGLELTLTGVGITSNVSASLSWTDVGVSISSHKIYGVSALVRDGTVNFIDLGDVVLSDMSLIETHGGGVFADTTVAAAGIGITTQWAFIVVAVTGSGDVESNVADLGAVS